MPNIVEYNAGSGELQPREGGIQSSINAGRRIGAAYQDIGRSIGGTIAYVGKEYQEQLTRHEYSAGSAALVNIQDGLTQDWNQTAANGDPNDIHMAEKWRGEKLDPALKAWRDQFTTKAGQDWADQQIGHLRQHFFEKTAADQSTLAGEAVVQNLMVLRDRSSNITLNDPTSFDSVAGLIDRSVDAQVAAHPNLDAGQAAKMRMELTFDMKQDAAKAAVIGAIQKSPDAGRALLKSGKFNDYISGPDAKQLDAYADSVERANEAQARAAEAEKVRADKEAFSAAGAKITGDMIDPATGDVRVPPDYFKRVAELAAMPHAEPGQIRAMIDMGEAVAAKDAKPVDDPHVYADFARRMTLPASDPDALSMTEIFRARAAGQLTDKSFTFYKDAVESGDKDPARKDAYKQLDKFMEDMKPSITRSNIFSGQIYPEQDQRYFQFQFDLHRAFDLRIKRGEKPADVANDLLDARSPNYFGKFIPQYAIGTQQGQQIMANSIARGVGVVPAVPGGPGRSSTGTKPPARLAGETPEAYLARTSGGKKGAPAPAAKPKPKPKPQPDVVDKSAGAGQHIQVKIKR